MATLIAAILGTAGCEETFGPLFSLDVRLSGPDYSYGDFHEQDAWRPEVGEGYLCSSFVTIRVARASRDHRGIRWTSARLDILQGGEVVASRALQQHEVAYVFGAYAWPGAEYESGMIEIVHGSLPFTWRVVGTYYDVESGHTQETDFASDCRSP